MNSNDNMLTNKQSILNNEIKNKGFAFLDNMFKEQGWYMIKNEPNWICYTKFGNELDVFDIKIGEKNINVSIPIKNSQFQYITSFKDYFQASEYIEGRFIDFIKKN
jgi:hypothetical protein